MEEGKVAEACPQLAESQRLDPGGGTVLALALCHEAEGKTATAWKELREALDAAQKGERRDREQFIRPRLDDLAARLSTLQIDLDPGAASSPGVRVLRDGAPVPRPEWGLAVPVDPGVHEVSLVVDGVSVSARTVSVGVARDHQRITLEVPRAENRPAAVAPPSPPEPAPVVVDADPRSGRRAAFYAGAAVGVVGLGLGAAYGIRAAHEWSSARSACPDRTCTDASGVQKASDARTAGYVSTVAFGVGLLGAGVAAYALSLGPWSTNDASSRLLRIAPSVAARAGGLVAEGAW